MPASRRSPRTGIQRGARLAPASTHAERLLASASLDAGDSTFPGVIDTLNALHRRNEPATKTTSWRRGSICRAIRSSSGRFEFMCPRPAAAGVPAFRRPVSAREHGPRGSRPRVPGSRTAPDRGAPARGAIVQRYKRVAPHGASDAGPDHGTVAYNLIGQRRGRVRGGDARRLGSCYWIEGVSNSVNQELQKAGCGWRHAGGVGRAMLPPGA